MTDDHGHELEGEELVLAQTTALLDARGDTVAVQLLLDVQSLEFVNTGDGYRTDTDWWVYLQAAVLEVEDHLVGRFTDEIKQRIADAIGYVAGRHGYSDVTSVVTRPALPRVDSAWRTTLKSRLDAERPSNHARRERDVSRHPTEDGLTFGSQEELKVYRALRALQQEAPEDNTLAILPLPAARLRAGHTWSPDCVVIGNGRALIFEIDGPHHRDGRRYVDDRNRDLQWSRCRVQVVRIAVEDVRDANKLKVRLKEEILRHLWPR
ncbi:hypothetical protein [Saccharothrix texasensis]|uniref:Uncharacterized protein n=1 Tax=Saccharothrix texasensis TaxID=103734 RepID=A0A3N1H4I6_9PSEU|nr:hypothetical protein [Saccharothrix texasensis]ROP37439.1 hypothetical protein EDD40_2752 [Saccharothrix texasensis]